MVEEKSHCCCSLAQPKTILVKPFNFVVAIFKLVGRQLRRPKPSTCFFPNTCKQKNMGRRTNTDSHHLQFKQSGSTTTSSSSSSARGIEYPSISISESLTDPKLPQDLFTQILLRLPVKSLLKLRCVSKSWLSLISSSQFIMSHFSRSSKEGEYLNLQLLSAIHNPTLGIKQFSLYSALHEPSTHVFDVEYPSHNPHHRDIVGIVNGLVCLRINVNDLFLWNPVLKTSKHVPSSGVDLKFSMTVNYSFGYDESNDDYKVVRLRNVCRNGFVEAEAKVEIYSLRADSWRKIEDLKGFGPPYHTGKYTNGKIYWFATETLTPKREIVSLDMGSEQYGELQQPDYEAGHFYWDFGVSDERLFVVCDYYGKKVDLWVMDKYGVEESWCDVLSIPYDVVHPPAPYPHQMVFCIVLCILSNGEIVLRDGTGLVVYNSKNKESRKIELDFGCSSYFQAVPYVESMVSPNG